MSWFEDFSKFLKIEEELDLFGIQIDGVKFWERIRFEVYATIINRASGGIKSSSRVGPSLSKLKRLVLSVLKFSRNPLRAPKSDILFIVSSRRFLEADGMWWDIYSEPIIDNLDVSLVPIETSFNNTHLTPAKTAHLRYFDYFEFMSYLKRRLGLVKVNFNESERTILKKIQSEIKSAFDFDLNIEALTQRVLEERKVKLPYYVKMLKRIRPKIAILVQGYNREDIIEACKLEGVPSAELQHGVIHPQHIAYSFAGESRTKEMFTDYLLLWGDHWKSGVEFPIPIENAISVGFPYLDLKRGEISTTSRKKQILFISQAIIGKVLSKFAVSLNNEIGREYSILYKLHPRECASWKERYPELAASDIQVIDNPGIRLHSLFPECSIQVGVCSTAIYEGLFFGLESYVVDAQCVETMQSLLQQGLVTKVSTPEELVGMIKDHGKSSKHDVSCFFQENSIERIKAFLDRFIHSEN